MPISDKFPKSPFEIVDPDIRWKPSIDKERDNFQHFHAPFVEKIRKEILNGDNTDMMKYLKLQEIY